ncbi:hypothetical protein FVQ98_10290 [Ottowia sp. GY511]|uniref:GlsB/YeaQ/YmgE family stress response membrane protein n=1 Tax=Ottowia flava TaxID=2675430 RepID=A0ABW4KNW4_9BURK|nr:hypothetical protein [Ottowia sp. GY511]TXK28355.1 hypothetical protein FVQ98_10290 [Ottowia sp. GY511]
MSPLLLEGLTDAAGFVLGGLVGFGVARLLGFDLFEPGYGNGSMFAILAVGLGAGGGRALARRWRLRRQAERQSKS